MSCTTYVKRTRHCSVSEYSGKSEREMREIGLECYECLITSAVIDCGGGFVNRLLYFKALRRSDGTFIRRLNTRGNHQFVHKAQSLACRKMFYLLINLLLL